MARYISIDADAHGLLVASGSASREKPGVERLIAATDLAQPLTMANAALIGTRLKQLLKDANISPAPALVVLGRDRIILKDIKHPPVPPTDEPGVIRFQALKEVAEGSEDMLFDYMPLPAVGLEKRATVAFVKKDLIAAVRLMCETAGLKLAAISPRPFAAEAALSLATHQGVAPPPDDGPIALVMAHEAGGEFTVIRKGSVTLTRSIPSAAVASEAALLAEIRRNLAVASGQVGSEIQAIYVAEGDTHGEGWSGRLRAELGLPVYPFDPLANIAAGANIPAELHGRFLGPIGLLASRQDAVQPINFVQPRQPRRGGGEESPAKKRVLIAALAAILLFGLLGIGGYLLLDGEQKDLARHNARIKRADEEIASNEADAKRVAAVEEFASREVNWLDEYYEQAARFPDIAKMQLLEFVGVAVPLPTEKERTAEAARASMKNAPPRKAATLTLTLQAANNTLPGALMGSIFGDARFYSGGRMDTDTAGGSARASGQKFTIVTNVAHRAPADYERKLVPVKLEPIKAPEKKETPVATPAPEGKQE